MKILHTCLNGPYNEGWNYQENILPRCQAAHGHEVLVVATDKIQSSAGYIQSVPVEDKQMQDGVRLIRLRPQKLINRYLTGFLYQFELMPILETFAPDIIMIHSFIGSISALQVAKYVRKKAPKCKIIVDNHADELNAGDTPQTFRKKLLWRYQRWINRKVFAMANVIYGVTPRRVQYAIKRYGAPKEKLSYLPMGCDPTLLKDQSKHDIRCAVREKYGLSDDDILLVHGGKLNTAKRTLELIQVVNRNLDRRLHLLIFGGVAQDIYDVFHQEIARNENIVYLGALEPREYYSLFMAADMAVFPGSHSVMWEEAVGCGVPLFVYNWTDSYYLDLGGNTKVIEQNDVDTIEQALLPLLNKEKLQEMRGVAETAGARFFSYEHAATLCEKVEKLEDLL